MFVFHIGALPTVLVGLISLHIYMIRAHGVSELGAPTTKDAKPFRFFPDHLLTEISLALFLMFVLTFLAVVFPAGLEDKANPLVTPEHIKPEWYFFWAFRWLKLMSDQAAVVTQGLFVTVIVAWPFIDSWIRKRKPESEASIAWGAAGMTLLIVLTVWEAFYLMH